MFRGGLVLLLPQSNMELILFLSIQIEGIFLRFKQELDEDEAGEFTTGILVPTTLHSGPEKGTVPDTVVCDLHVRAVGGRAWVS